MTEAEEFFLSCVDNGQIIVRADGIITHVSTGHSAWATGSGGYPKISKLDSSTRKIRHIQCHRLMWLVFNGEIPAGFEVNHRDGVKTNYRLRNLELLTPLDNTKHAHNTGLISSRKGVRNGYSKFSVADVATIKWMLEQGKKPGQIAPIFNVHRKTIEAIVRGDRYTDIAACEPLACQ